MDGREGGRAQTLAPTGDPRQLLPRQIDRPAALAVPQVRGAGGKWRSRIAICCLASTRSSRVSTSASRGAGAAFPITLKPPCPMTRLAPSSPCSFTSAVKHAELNAVGGRTPCVSPEWTMSAPSVPPRCSSRPCNIHSSMKGMSAMHSSTASGLNFKATSTPIAIECPRPCFRFPVHRNDEASDKTFADVLAVGRTYSDAHERVGSGDDAGGVFHQVLAAETALASCRASHSGVTDRTRA